MAQRPLPPIATPPDTVARDTVAVIGLGGMGSRIARRFLDHGHPVTVWNRSPGRAEALAEHGAMLAESPADATRRASVVVTMVADPLALRAVTEGPDGIVAGAEPPTTVLEMSTVGPEAISRLRSILPQDVELLDTPVLGSLTEAENGSLQIFVGGEASLASKVDPMLSELGTTTHVGPLGAGAAAKLVANLSLFGVLGVLGEAVALGRGVGLSDGAIFDVLATTPVAVQAQRRRSSIEQNDYPTRFTLLLARKDADLIAGAAAKFGGDLRLAEAARSWLAEAADDTPDLDYSAVLAFILRQRES